VKLERARKALEGRPEAADDHTNHPH
jgi:hypothetical protein